MGLNLARRAAEMGTGINTRTEFEGTEKFVAFDIPIKAFPLTAEDLAEVCLMKDAYKRCYRKIRGRPDEPVWNPLMQPFKLSSKIKGVNVILYVGRKQVKFIDVNLTGAKLEFAQGGITFMHFAIQCRPVIDDTIESIFDKVGEKVDVSIECDGYGAQPELPMEDPEDDEEEEEEGEDEGEE